jgi:integrase
VRLGLAGTPILREELVMSAGSRVLIDAAGRRRSPATIPGYLAGRAPRDKGDAVSARSAARGRDRSCDASGRPGPARSPHSGVDAVLWRGGLRISEALALNETDIDEHRRSLLIRHGKGDKRREAGMDQFGFEHLAVWLTVRVLLPRWTPVLRHRRTDPRTTVGGHRLGRLRRSGPRPGCCRRRRRAGVHGRHQSMASALTSPRPRQKVWMLPRV